jgi:hypothetical protein
LASNDDGWPPSGWRRRRASEREWLSLPTATGEPEMIAAAVAEARRRLFKPNAIYIPTKDGKEGRDFDRGDCTLLFVDGEFSHAEVFTEEAWKHGEEPSYVQRRGDFFLPDGSEIPVGKAQLLPDACIVKLPEREYWCEDVQTMTARIFGVYALDRRQHFNLCEFCASYELWFIEHQYEAIDQVDHDEEKRDELYELILDGGRYEEQVTYEHRKDIDPMFLRGRRCRPGWLPNSDHGGGYRLRGIRAVTWDGVMEEIAQRLCNSDI